MYCSAAGEGWKSTDDSIAWSVQNRHCTNPPLACARNAMRSLAGLHAKARTELSRIVRLVLLRRSNKLNRPMVAVGTVVVGAVGACSSGPFAGLKPPPPPLFTWYAMRWP